MTVPGAVTGRSGRRPGGGASHGRRAAAAVLSCGLAAAAGVAGPPGLEAQAPTSAPAPLEVGETFTVESRELAETRRINLYRPPAWGEPAGSPRPVLYMLDGGIGEDFLHIAGLVQISVLNGTMRPVLLVGIENTQRRRDLTGPTTVAADREIAPEVGGSGRFRAFLRDELMPLIDARYATTGETALVGESLAGLFVVETLLLEPGLFDHYLAVDPSLWWDGGALVDRAGLALRKAFGQDRPPRTVFLASSDQPEIAALTARLADTLSAVPAARGAWHHAAFPGETHGTVYHPAALQAFRRVLAPDPATP